MRVIFRPMNICLTQGKMVRPVAAQIQIYATKGIFQHHSLNRLFCKIGQGKGVMVNCLAKGFIDIFELVCLKTAGDQRLEKAGR